MRQQDPHAQPTLERNLSTEEAAAFLGVKPRTLVVKRVRGDGPPFYKLGTRVVYSPTDLRAWLAQRRRTSTSDPGPADQPDEHTDARPRRQRRRARR